MARLREAAGDLDGAVGLLQEADRLYVGDFAPDVRPVGADLARILAARGDITDALERLRARGITSHDALSYLHEYEHVTLARVLIDGHADSRDVAALSEATDLLQRLLAAARAGDRTRSTIEVLNVLSVATAASGDRTRALHLLDEAVDLAGTEGFLGVFTLDRRHLQPLVHDVLTDGAADQFLRRVGDLLDDSPDGDDEEAAGVREKSALSGGARPSKPQVALVEPLSDRELEVLRYLCSELDGPGIARQLSVSLSTVRTHTQHIYAKLGVNNRRAAVRRAHQLDLLAAGAHRR
jgi:LuxR family maltose regulon positive regulatory protein